MTSAAIWLLSSMYSSSKKQDAETDGRSIFGLEEGMEEFVEKKEASLRTGAKLCSALSLQGGVLTRNDLRKLFQNSILLYTAFLLMGSLVYHQLGGNFHEMSMIDWLGYLSTMAEGYGLISLRAKIQRQKSVAGISGTTVVIYGLLYGVRSMMLPPGSLVFLDAWAVKVLEIVSLLMVWDVVRHVFVTYRSTYLQDLEVIRVWHIVPGLVLLATLLHPDIHLEVLKTVAWTCTLYIDSFALLPQVVMMSRCGGKVEAPISHFVAATALSRLVDLSSWYYAFDTVGPVNHVGINYSGWLIVALHLVHELLVADFMYFYAKQRLQMKSLSEDLTIPMEHII